MGPGEICFRELSLGQIEGIGQRRTGDRSPLQGPGERPWEAVVASLVEISAQIQAPWEHLAIQLPTCRASDSIGLDGNKTPR